MRKQYDIELGGRLMTTDLFETLAYEWLCGGLKHYFRKNTIEYAFGAYSSVKEDMRNFERYCKEQGFKVKKSKRNSFITTENGELTAQIITYSASGNLLSPLN